MKKKRIVLIVLIIVLTILAVGIGLFIKKLFEPESERVNKEVYAETGETIRVEELVSMENYRSATISPELILPTFSSDAEVRDNGQSVFIGYTMCAFDVIVYVTDEEGKVTEERVTVVPTRED